MIHYNRPRLRILNTKILQTRGKQPVIPQSNPTKNNSAITQANKIVSESIKTSQQQTPKEPIQQPEKTPALIY